MAAVWARGASKKMWDPLRIFATVAASNFKFGTQTGFETSLPKNNDLDQNWIGGGLGEGSIRKNLGPPNLFLQPTEKLVHNRFTLLNTSVRTKLGIGSELGEYHSPPHYDDDATVYSTCHQKLTGTQISLLSGIMQKI